MESGPMAKEVAKSLLMYTAIIVGSTVALSGAAYMFLDSFSPKGYRKSSMRTYNINRLTIVDIDDDGNPDAIFPYPVTKGTLLIYRESPKYYSQENKTLVDGYFDISKAIPITPEMRKSVISIMEDTIDLEKTCEGENNGRR